ncbi:hypothetical protein L596_018652 [Steinernema carpocapsae]|uniref:SHSP domain-containing protein n=1 Tax=Steinernema carpocapsae TaxID=34508 RepID=A0A4V6A284_STECR|nr:hypothetical protein L596_018652 [Steinernema carpocapsae]
MALLLSDAFFPGFGSVRLHRRRDPFAALFGNSPLAESSKVAFKDGVLSIGFPTSAFKPEELEVNVVGNNLVVEAKHSLESESGSIERLFVQKVRLPEDVDFDSIQGTMDAQGNLSVTARARKPAAIEGKRNIPIGIAPTNEDE